MKSKMSRPYVGYNVDGPNGTHPMEVFRSAFEPTWRSHSHKYLAVIGPFRTMRGARFMAEHGRGNPHCRNVAEAERLAERYATREPDDEGRHPAWSEYESAAKWCAARGLSGEPGSPLPEGISRDCSELILADVEAFAERVRDHAYARSMNRIDLPKATTRAGTLTTGGFVNACGDAMGFSRANGEG